MPRSNTIAPTIAPRAFLRRPEATYLLGLMDAAHRREPAGVRVACRDRRTREVFEAEGDEVLHAQIALRVGRAGGPLEDGWTVPLSVFPHKGGCEECARERRCNYCGAEEVIPNNRCTNGRCASCHMRVCTANGATSPGHAFGHVLPTSAAHYAHGETA